MKTKRLFLRCAAMLVALAPALSGCGDDNTKPKEPTPPDYNNLKFAITVADKPGVTGQTANWVNGDRIVVFFGTSANRALLTYNGSGWDASEVSISSLSAMSVAQAFHAADFSTNGGNISGITRSGKHGRIAGDETPTSTSSSRNTRSSEIV